MKVICISEVGDHGKKLQINVGEVYNANECPGRTNHYILDELPTYMGEQVCYNKKHFTPTSDIDETTFKRSWVEKENMELA